MRTSYPGAVGTQGDKKEQILRRIVDTVRGDLDSARYRAEETYTQLEETQLVAEGTETDRPWIPCVFRYLS